MNRLAFSFLLMALFLFGAAPFLYSSELNILASQDVNNSKESSDHKHVNISIGMYGGGSASVSMDRSKGSSDGITSTNSQLRGNNINITTEETTTIAGANIAANDELNIKTEHLNVASVQDSNNSRSQSSGFSVSGGTDGISGAGVNAGNARFRAKETVLTTLTGNNVNINVEEDTTIRGALIAAVDENGDDNGNLTLKTDTLEVGSLNNRRDSKSMSMGINVGISNSENKKTGDTDSSLSSVGIDFANDRSNSKTKTLGTIGSGNIEVANVDGSNTKLLNRDINDNEIDIYNIESHRGLKGELDVRMLTEDGRKSIKEDVERSKRFGKAIGDVATSDAFKIGDTFDHIGDVQKDLDVQKRFALETGGQDIKTLQGEKGVTMEQKQAAIERYAAIYADVYDVNIEKARIIATNEAIGGTAYTNNARTKSEVDINDNAQKNATDYANKMGHEVAHVRMQQGQTRDRGEHSEEYADTMGGYSADGMEFSANTYTKVQLDPNKTTNAHTQTPKDQELLADNNQAWRKNIGQAANGEGSVDFDLTFGGRDLNGAGGLDAKHAFNIVSRTNVSDFTQEDREKLGEPIKLGKGKVGYVVEHLSINGKLVPVVNGKMKNADGTWSYAPKENGGDVTANEYRAQQQKQDKDDMTIIREHKTEEGSIDAENKLMENINLDKRAPYPSTPSSIKCGSKENDCSSEALPNSNEGGRKDYEGATGNTITYKELEEKKKEAGSYFPGMLPKDRIPNKVNP